MIFKWKWCLLKELFTQIVEMNLSSIALSSLAAVKNKGEDLVAE